MACSTAKAVEWDAAWANNLDPSGRAALGVHLSAYEPQPPATSAADMSSNVIDTIPGINKVTTAPGLAIQTQ